MSKPIINAREKLLITGKKMLLRDGYFNLYISRLTRECQMATGTFYSYFPSKADLVMEIIKPDWDNLLDTIDIKIEKVSTFDQKLRCIYQEFQGFYNIYGNIWIQFGSEQGNHDMYKITAATRIQQLADRIEQIIKEISAAHPEIVLPEKTSLLAILIVQNLLLIARIPAFSYDRFINAWQKWMLLTKV